MALQLSEAFRAFDPGFRKYDLLELSIFLENIMRKGSRPFPEMHDGKGVGLVFVVPLTEDVDDALEWIERPGLVDPAGKYLNFFAHLGWRKGPIRRHAGWQTLLQEYPNAEFLVYTYRHQPGATRCIRMKGRNG